MQMGMLQCPPEQMYKYQHVQIPVKDYAPASTQLEILTILCLQDRATKWLVYHTATTQPPPHRPSCIYSRGKQRAEW